MLLSRLDARVLDDAIVALVLYGARVDVVDPSTGKTPLHYACDEPVNFARVAALVAADGAGVHGEDYDGLTPLQYLRAAPPSEDRSRALQMLSDK
ncbi:hypothetical protein F4780DRAFT_740555 [Xylariomycetidae sp. FL0641]|nr:hypothetical protein F4780DRAFT_740555 [Xylariomycetidae sp. FL0641]